MVITSQDVLVVVDVQNDFCAGGALAVPDGDGIVEIIHSAGRKFEHIVLTQDWHPSQHFSFASAHPGRKAFESVEAAYGPQTLWPDHCIQGTAGAEFHPSLFLPEAELVMRKGYRRGVDSYSAFFDNDRVTPTGLGGYMRERGFTRAFFAGLAYDFCVGYSALDARRLGFSAVVLRDASRSIDLNGSAGLIEEEFRRAGVAVVETQVLGA